MKAQIKAEDFSGLVKTAVKLQDPFADIMKYLFESYGRVPELYRMDKTAGLDANTRSSNSKKFVTERLAAGSPMLANLWYTAWVGSASQKPDGH